MNGMSNLLYLRGWDAVLYAAFCLAGVGLYYSMKYVMQGGR